jgi:hypothetical protein
MTAKLRPAMMLKTMLKIFPMPWDPDTVKMTPPTARLVTVWEQEKREGEDFDKYE